MKKTILLVLTLFLCAPAYAQAGGDLTVLFESQQGFRLAALLDSIVTSFNQRADLNLDGTPDLTLLSLDEQNVPREIITIDMAASLDTLWRFSFAEIASAMGTNNFRLIGFFSFSPTGPRHAIFRGPGVLGIIAILIGKNSAADPIVLPMERAAVLDLTGDGFTEVILQNSETGTVQILGDSGTNTATEEEIEAALHRLFQNYPNPFHTSTTIAYEVEKAGPVTVMVYDVLGRRVRTLVDETQPVGTYQAVWDGRDGGGQPVAAGTYFYRLRVGQATTSKQAIHIK